MLKTTARTYQPIWVKGEQAGNPFQRPCEERYEPIRDLAKKFNRPFSVLDIGSNYAYFDMRLQYDFDCCTVMVDRKFIADVLRLNDAWGRSVVIQKHLSAATLEALSKSEHFDIVLGLAVLHHFDDPVRAYKAIRNLGWWSIFEIPGKGDIGAANPGKHKIIQECFDMEPDGYFPSHVSDSKRPWYILENEPSIFEQSMDSGDRDAPVYNEYHIECDFDKSLFKKWDISDQRYIEERDFIPGMNLWNFMRLDGMWPSQEIIQEATKEYQSHPDFHPWNFIVGNGIHPIDMDDSKEWKS